MPLGRKVHNQTFRRRPGRMDVGVAFAKQHERHVAPEQTRSGDNDRFKHGPRIGRRLADDAQYLCGRGLPRERLPRFVDVPRVHHRDLSLNGEALNERDLPVGERTNLPSKEIDDPDDGAALAQRHTEVSSDAADLDAGDGQGNPVAVGLGCGKVGDVKKGPLLDGSAEDLRRRNRLAIEEFEIGHGEVASADRARSIAVEEPHAAEGRPAEPHCPFHDRFEHRREIALRRIDDLEHFGRRGLLRDRLVALGERGH